MMYTSQHEDILYQSTDPVPVRNAAIPAPDATVESNPPSDSSHEVRPPSPRTVPAPNSAHHELSATPTSPRSEYEIPLTEVDSPRIARQDTRRHSIESRQRKLSLSPSQVSELKLSELAAGRPLSNSRLSDDEENGETPAQPRDDLEEKREIEKLQKTYCLPFGLASELFIVSWLIFFSLLGTLARLGVEAITLYPNTPFPSRVLWANLGGSFVMGFLAEDQRLFREEWGWESSDSASKHGKVKKTIPLYIGLATGFCGSFTSFSSYMRDCFLAMSNTLDGPSPTSPYHTVSSVPSRNGGFSFLALLAVLITHPAISIAALQVGAQFALLLQPILPTLPYRICRTYVDPLGAILGWGCWLGAVFLSIFPPGENSHWRFRATFPLVFAPLGCLMRFYLSKFLNARIPAFPLGTFVVNIFGTAVLGMAWDLQHAHSIGAAPNGSVNACAILQGVMEGYCGCLTTVSTWVAELLGLRRRNAWIYGLTSVGVGLGMMVVIMGSMNWTVGFATPLCD